MKNNKIVFAILLLSIIIQNFIMVSGGEQYYEFGFCMGFYSLNKSLSSAIPILCVLSPIFFIIFLFSESTFDLTHGYGKLLIIRKCSKTKLLLKEILNILIILTLLQSVQIAIFAFNSKNLKNVDFNICIKAFVLYYFTVMGVLLLQVFFEFIISPRYVTFIIMTYVLVSYFCAYYIDCIVVNLLFFPSLAFGQFNGSFINNNKYYIAILCIILFNSFFIVINIHKFKKTDIF